MERTTHLFLSPHLDDVVFSCGGLVAQLAASGHEVEIVSCLTEGPDAGAQFSSEVQALHKLWKMDTDDEIASIWQRRRDEDEAAVAALGARRALLGYRDSIYRGGMYYSRDTVMNHVQPGDWETLTRLSAELVERWRATPRAVVYLPLAIGHHVDHQLVFMTSGALRDAGAEVWHYEDFPYVYRERHALELRLAELGARYRPRIVDVTEHIEKRLTAIALYANQIEATFGKIGPYRDVTLTYAASVAAASGRYAERLWTLDAAV